MPVPKNIREMCVACAIHMQLIFVCTELMHAAIFLSYSCRCRGWKGPLETPHPAPPEQFPVAGAWESIPAGLKYLQGKRSPHLSGQLVLGL